MRKHVRFSLRTLLLVATLAPVALYLLFQESEVDEIKARLGTIQPGTPYDEVVEELDLRDKSLIEAELNITTEVRCYKLPVNHELTLTFVRELDPSNFKFGIAKAHLKRCCACANPFLACI